MWLNPLPATLFVAFGLYIAYGFTLSWVHLFLIPLLLGSFMFTRTFQKWAMFFSLRKFGYKGKIKFVKETNLFLRLAKWGKAE